MGVKIFWHVGLLIPSLRQFRWGPLWFVLMFLLNIVLPMIYLMWLPLDENRQLQDRAAAGVVNSDILLRLWQFARFIMCNLRYAELQRCWSKLEMHTLALARRSPTIRRTLEDVSPRHKRLLKAPSRSI